MRVRREYQNENRDSRPSQRITLAGFGAAIAVISIIMSFYIRPLKLVFKVSTVMGIMLPLTRGYYKEAIWEYIAVIVLGAIFINIKILTFALTGGLYTIIAVYLDRNTKKIPWYFAILIKIAYSIFLFGALYLILNAFYMNTSKFGYVWTPAATYIFANLIFIGIFFFYDKFIVASFNLFARYIEKIIQYH